MLLAFGTQEVLLRGSFDFGDLVDRFKLAVLDVSVDFRQLELRDPQHHLLFLEFDLQLLNLLFHHFGLIINFLELISLVEILRLKVIP